MNVHTLSAQLRSQESVLRRAGSNDSELHKYLNGENTMRSVMRAIWGHCAANKGLLDIGSGVGFVLLYAVAIGSPLAIGVECVLERAKNAYNAQMQLLYDTNTATGPYSATYAHKMHTSAMDIQHLTGFPVDINVIYNFLPNPHNNDFAYLRHILMLLISTNHRVDTLLFCARPSDMIEAGFPEEMCTPVETATLTMKGSGSEHTLYTYTVPPSMVDTTQPAMLLSQWRASTLQTDPIAARLMHLLPLEASLQEQLRAAVEIPIDLVENRVL